MHAYMHTYIHTRVAKKRCFQSDFNYNKCLRMLQLECYTSGVLNGPSKPAGGA